jgi:hypothetical protein
MQVILTDVSIERVVQLLAVAYDAYPALAMHPTGPFSPPLPPAPKVPMETNDHHGRAGNLAFGKRADVLVPATSAYPSTFGPIATASTGEECRSKKAVFCRGKILEQTPVWPTTGSRLRGGP